MASVATGGERRRRARLIRQVVFAHTVAGGDPRIVDETDVTIKEEDCACGHRGGATRESEGLGGKTVGRVPTPSTDLRNARPAGEWCCCLLALEDFRGGPIV